MRFQASIYLSSVLLALSLAAAPFAVADAADRFHVLHSFCKKAGCPDGGPSVSGVVLDEAGNLFGAAQGGPDYGVIFALTPGIKGLDTVYARLHVFCKGTCKDGGNPDFPLIRDTAGNFYGTAAQGGLGNGGTIFELMPVTGGWKLKVLYAFCAGDCQNGLSPSSGLTYQGAAFGMTYDGKSPLYGTTSLGGTQNGGTVYVFARSGGKAQATALYDFCSTLPCDDGTLPLGGLAMDAAGNIFGVANLGGAHDEGAVFELSPAGGTYNYSLVYSFCSAQNCTDGIRPQTGLAIDASGNLFGTTPRQGTRDEGTLFELSPNGSGYDFEVLYQFCSEVNCTGGGAPAGPLTIDASGNIFGTTTQFGSASGGTIFEFSPDQGGWTESVLHSFCGAANCTDGSIPESPLTMDAGGNLFGTAVAGGAIGAGVVYELAR